MRINRYILFLLGTFLSLAGIAQQVIYSEPDRSDVRQTNFEILGKVGGNILIYKNLRDVHYMSVYDANMVQLDKVKYNFMPDRVINTDFLSYPDFSYMFYQYQKKNIVYCMAAKINGSGKKMGDPIVLDTTTINFWSSNKLYSVISSEDRQLINVVKINTKNDENHIVTSAIFNKELVLQERVVLSVNMPDRNDYLTEFQLDNRGNLVFARTVQGGQEDRIQKLFLYVKPFGNNLVRITNVDLNESYLDDLRIKPDNTTNRYIISSFYTKGKQGNIDGLFVAVLNNNSSTLTTKTLLKFDDNLRSDAKGENSFKTALNDYFIKNIIPKKDGGFLLAAEAFFTTGRGGLNRNNYMYGSPFLRPSDFYMFSPYSSYGYPWWRFNNSNTNQLNRYHAQNILVMSFDSTGHTDWSNILNKNQWDDDSDASIGYQLVNTGDQLHFLFNMQEKRTQLLSDQSIKPDGQLLRNPTLKNLDKGYDFMPRYGKQVGLRQIIIPCMYRNFLCFARVEL
ncbi:MAG: hypothetical protein LH478_14245 [Chitinophagaceae bacterium]|nr:hypothetical protein [Chitinophagaceae bacterium]